MKRGFLILIALFLFLTFGFQVSAGVVTSCGGSKGYAYYFQGEVVPADKEGWQPDQISTGGILFTLDGEKADIILKDASDRTRSVKEDGAFVEILHIDSLNETIIVMVFYPAGALEHYLFKLDKQGAGKVVWGTAKAAGRIVKNSLMVADCKK